MFADPHSASVFSFTRATHLTSQPFVSQGASSGIKDFNNSTDYNGWCQWNCFAVCSIYHITYRHRNSINNCAFSSVFFSHNITPAPHQISLFKHIKSLWQLISSSEKHLFPALPALTRLKGREGSANNLLWSVIVPGEYPYIPTETQ